jgi:threonine dehydratase
MSGTELARNTEISLEDIQSAASKIRGFAFRTPCYRSFSEENLFLKLECYQPVRSFKIRGASNKINSIPVKDRKERGVITASSGNHGLAVAYVSHLLGIKATIVLPESVIPDKLEWIQALGARIVLSGKQQDERARKAEEIMQAEGQIYVQPFNDREIIAGQATCASEIFEDVSDTERLYVPIGGGGLISGIAACAKIMGKNTRIIGVQPEGSPSMYESWKKNELLTIPESKTIADGLSVRKPGDITFSFVQRYVDDIVLVSDDEILSATRQLLRKEHVLAEPSGAASLAGYLKQSREGSPKSVVVVSGGNVSGDYLKRVLS